MKPRARAGDYCFCLTEGIQPKLELLAPDNYFQSLQGAGWRCRVSMVYHYPGGTKSREDAVFPAAASMVAYCWIQPFFAQALPRRCVAYVQCLLGLGKAGATTTSWLLSRLLGACLAWAEAWAGCLAERSLETVIKAKAALSPSTGSFWCAAFLKRETQYVTTLYKEKRPGNKVGIFSLTSVSSMESKKQQKMQ